MQHESMTSRYFSISITKVLIVQRGRVDLISAHCPTFTNNCAHVLKLPKQQLTFGSLAPRDYKGYITETERQRGNSVGHMPVSQLGHHQNTRC